MTELNDKKTTVFTVYNQRLAGYLMLHGFPLRFLIHQPNRNQFLFDNTDKVQQAISEWKSTKK